MFKFGRQRQVKPALVDLLERLLRHEYTLAVNYPRLARLIKDVATRESAIGLGKASLKHADLLANALNGLGGSPSSSFEQIDDESDLVEVFTQQLAREREVQQIHLEGQRMATDKKLKSEFLAMADEETEHIQTVEKILIYLKKETPERLSSPAPVLQEGDPAYLPAAPALNRRR